MPRPRAGWRIVKRPNERNYRVVFTGPDGRQQKPSTGTDDWTEAHRTGERIYTGAFNGESPARRASGAVEAREPAADARRAETALEGAAARWLAAVAGTTLAIPTADAYNDHFRAHLVPFFGTVEAITRERTRDYADARLKRVKAKTARKELGTLRGLLRWLGVSEAEIAARVYEIPRRAVGTAHPKGKRARTPMSRSEAIATLRQLPERDRRDRLVRWRYAFAYYTSLRPRTIATLEFPTHWQVGSAYLDIESKNDKAQAGRRLPMPRAARLILHWLVRLKLVEPGELFFGAGQNRKALKAAARGVLGELGGSMHRYALRQNRITHLLDGGVKPSAVQLIAGHSRFSTTASYVTPNERETADELAKFGR